MSRGFFSEIFESFLALVVFFAIILLVFFGVTRFTSCGKSAPEDLKSIAMPTGEDINADSAPIYRAAVSIPIPFDATSDDFVFAEVVTDGEYHATERKQLWAKLRSGRHYPPFTPPLDITIRSQSLQRDFVLPVDELRGGAMSKYWLRFGIVTIASRRLASDQGVRGIEKSIGSGVDVLAGNLVLVFFDRGGLEIRSVGKWTQWTSFWIAP